LDKNAALPHMAIDEKKLKKRDNDAGVFMVISDK
jgi:hypothetical protein